MEPLKENSNCYMPAFFHMSLTFPFNDAHMVLYNLSKQNLAYFFHEYIHYIQDLTTYWGLNNAYVYSEFMHEAVNQIYKFPYGNIQMPIKVNRASNNIGANQSLIEECTGDYKDKNPFILDVFMKKKKCCFKNSFFNEFEQVYLKLPKGEEIHFGARAIMESMAYLIEKEIAPGGTSVNEYPYKAAESILHTIYPELTTDTLNIIALCDMSLQFSNPAKIFFQTIQEFKLRNYLPQTPEEIYDYFYEIPCIHMGKKSTLIQGLVEIGITTCERLKTYLSSSEFKSFHEMLNQMIGIGLNYRINNRYFILDIVRNGNALYNVPLLNILNELGSPVIKDVTNTYYMMPSYKSLNNNLQFLVAVEQIYKLFTGDLDGCGMYEWCEKSIKLGTKIDDRCIFSPWERCQDKILCPYAALWKHWNLSNYKPEFK